MARTNIPVPIKPAPAPPCGRVPSAAPVRVAPPPPPPKAPRRPRVLAVAAAIEGPPLAWRRVKGFPPVHLSERDGHQLRVAMTPGAERRPNDRYRLYVDGSMRGAFERLQDAQTAAALAVGAAAPSEAAAAKPAKQPKVAAVRGRRPAAPPTEPQSVAVRVVDEFEVPDFVPAPMLSLAQTQNVPGFGGASVGGPWFVSGGYVPDVPEARIPDPPTKGEAAEIAKAAAAPVGAILLPPEKAAAASVTVATAAGGWSPYQTAVYEFIRVGTGNAVIAAVAGSGKTTTIMEALKYVPDGKSVLICAFNTSIQKELEAKVARNAPGRGFVVRTLVGHGYSILRDHWKTPFLSPELGDLRDKTVMMEAFGNDRIGGRKVWDTIGDVQKLIGLCESYLALTDDAIRAVMVDYDLFVKDGDPMRWEYEGGTKDRPRVWRHADVMRWVKAALRNQLTDPAGRTNYGAFGLRDDQRARYAQKTDNGSTAFISFRDMVFVPAVNKDWIPRQQFDFVFVDETQDMDVAQLEIIQRSVAPGGRIVVVGDERQSIYRFRGADANAIPRMRDRLAATTLPLSVSYRVPQCSAREAQRVVSNFEVPPDAPEGTCEQISGMDMLKKVKEGDFIITRKNAPILPLALRCIREGLRPYVMGEGNQIPRMLKGVIDKIAQRMSARDRGMESFERALSAWANGERETIAGRKRESIKRWEFKTKRKWQDVEGTIENDSEYQQVAFLSEALWNYDGTGLAQDKKRVKTVDDLKAIIDAIAPSEADTAKMDPEEFKAMLAKRVVITSVHRIKGAEAPVVFILEETFNFTRRGLSSKREMKPVEVREEENLWYVAVTRVKYTRPNPAKGVARHDGELYYVRGLERILGRDRAWDADEDEE